MTPKPVTAPPFEMTSKAFRFVEAFLHLMEAQVDGFEQNRLTTHLRR